MSRPLLLLLILVTFPGAPLVSMNSPGNNDADNPLRIEIPVRSVNETYRVIPCGAHGMILFFRSLEPADESRTNWYFTLYDTNLQQVWVRCVPLHNDQGFRFQQDGQDTLALLFVRSGKSKGSENIYEILRIALQSGTLILNTGMLEEDAAIDAFCVQKDRAWLGVAPKGKAGEIVTIGLTGGFRKSFPLGVGDQLSVIWMKPDSAAALLSALVNRQLSKKTSEYYLVSYDTNGTIRSEVRIGEQGGERMLTQARVVRLDDGSEFFAGSYGQGISRSNRKGRASDESTGIFAGRVNSGLQNAIRFYNFLELNNAGSIVGENDIMNLKKKALKKQKSLGEYSLDYSVLLHEVNLVKGQYVMTAELFAPQYHTENFTDFDFYGRPYTNSYSVFDGYRFYSAVVAGFDPGGRLLWDNNIEIRNLVSFDLTPKIVTFPAGDDLVLCYLSDGKIGSKIIKGNNVVEKLDFTTMDLRYPDDKLLSETRGMLVHWYKNYFLSYGYQEIKNIALESDNKRLVFYFTKVKFEP